MSDRTISARPDEPREPTSAPVLTLSAAERRRVLGLVQRLERREPEHPQWVLVRRLNRALAPCPIGRDD